MVKQILKRNKKQQKLPARITNDTVAQHREKILAGGRKHKYPLQYTKRRVVWLTLIISSVVFVATLALLWVQLYVWKDTSDVTYRITNILPLPVAQVDGENARYSDYLLYHRSTMAVLENQGQLESHDKVVFQRQQAMNKALEDAYARKLAKQHNISVEQSRVDDLVKQQQTDSKLSAAAYESVVKENLHWSMDELRTALRHTLLRQDVAFAVDDNAKKLSQEVQAALAAGKSFREIADQYGERVQVAEGVTVAKSNSDGGLTTAALRLQPNTTSGAIKTLSGDGYYFISLKSLEGNNVTYSYLRVPLTAFKQQFEALKDDHKITQYINVD